ncbi:MAG: hypothetical protein ACI89U_001468 [Gammaproteobacteria bacterium]|jgi:hypothetical protein
MLRFNSFLHLLGYVLLIAPPRAIDLTVSERTRQGELSRQPLSIVMLVELLIRVAFILFLAVGLESIMGEIFYETYRLDVVFSIVAGLGACHSFVYLLFLGYLRKSIGKKVSLRIYRLLRNFCYASLPGMLVVLPLLVWKWRQDQLPFEDDLVLKVYFITTALMAAAGAIEALIMKRKPLGLDQHLNVER